MEANVSAVFDGWELALASSPVEGAVLRWSTSPASGEGLLVKGAGDAAVDHLPSIDSVCLVRSSLTARGVAELLRRGVRTLALLDCAAVAGGFEEAGTSALEALFVSGASDLDSRGLRPLGAASLHTLCLDGIAPNSLMRWLSPLTSLRTLDLSRPRGEPALGRALAPLAALVRLERFALRRAHVTAAALKHIAALPALRELDLSGGSLSAPPAAWRALRKLTSLRLRGASGVEALLRALEGLGELRELDLRGHRFGMAPLSRLEKALPAATIFVDAFPEPVRAPLVALSAGAPLPSRAKAPIPPLPEAPLRWPDDAPSVASLHDVIPDPDGRGTPCGIDMRYDLRAIAAKFHPADVIRGIGPTAPAEVNVSGLILLAPLVEAFDPLGDRFAGAALQAARSLLAVEDGVSWTWYGTQTARFITGALASVAVLKLLGARAGARGVSLAEDAAVLREVLLAELAREGGQPWFVSSHIIGRSRDPGFEDAVASWVGWLATIVHDAQAPSRARISALERLDRDRERLPAPARVFADEAWSRMLPILAEYAASGATEMHFRRAVRSLVAARVPAMLDEMRDAGTLASGPLPNFARVCDGLGGASVERVLPLAPAVDGATCIAALDGSDPAAWFAALAFAPWCGSDAEARALAERAASLIGRSDTISLDGALASQSTRLGELAASALDALVQKRGVPREGLLERALESIRHVPVDVQLVTPPGGLLVMRTFAPHGTGLPDAVRERFEDRGVPAAERFQLLLLCWELRRDRAQSVLLDETEDGDLRALVGCLSGLDEPADRPVPLCEPFSTVSLASLRCSLATGNHPVSVRRAWLAYVSRVRPFGADDATLARGAEELRATPTPPTLRAIADGDSGLGRLAGVRWLAVLGESEDRDRIARVMAEEGGWTARRPQPSAARTPIEHLMSALVQESVVEDCESELEPLLRIGFGDDGTRRILASAYVHIACRHGDADRLDFARRSAAYAAELDPLNLDAVRLVKRLRGT